jgi:hypothetical protein
MNIRKIAAPILLLVVAGAGFAQAPTAKTAPPVPDGPKIDFVAVDKDVDGRVSKDEALQVPDLNSAFEMLDSDRNQFISPVEFSRWSRAGKVDLPRPDPAVAPGGSAGAQHMPGNK